MEILWTIIVTLVGGLILGLLGKLLAPGDKDNIPLWLTVVCGIVGMILGSFLYFWIFGHDNTWRDGGKVIKAEWDNTSDGIDWLRHLWQIVVAAIAVVIASTVTGRNTNRV